MKRAIIIMAKAPSAGEVKTRLQPALSPEQCAALAAALLQDAVDKAQTKCDSVILAYSPPGKINALRKLLPSQNIFIQQTGNDLGERISNAFEFAFQQNSDSVVMIGTDSPTFPPKFIEQSFGLLETLCDAVLGKTVDGGFYLIGLRKADKRIFENVKWSSEKTFEHAARNIKSLNLKLEEIPLWYDVDELLDLERLKNELKKNPAAAPQTSEYLKNLKLQANDENLVAAPG